MIAKLNPWLWRNQYALRHESIPPPLTARHEPHLRRYFAGKPAPAVTDDGRTGATRTALCHSTKPFAWPCVRCSSRPPLGGETVVTDLSLLSRQVAVNLQPNLLAIGRISKPPGGGEQRHTRVRAYEELLTSVAPGNMSLAQPSCQSYLSPQVRHEAVHGGTKYLTRLMAVTRNKYLPIQLEHFQTTLWRRNIRLHAKELLIHLVAANDYAKLAVREAFF